MHNVAGANSQGLKGRFTHAMQRQTQCKCKCKGVHLSNAYTIRVKHAHVIEYPKMVDEVDGLALMFFLFLGLWLIRIRHQVQRNNKTRPNMHGFRKSFEKDDFREVTIIE